MKKYFLIFINIILLITIIHYYIYSYDIVYYIDNYQINEQYDMKNKIIKFNIVYNDKEYYFEINKKRFFNKKIINNIDLIEEDNLVCLIPNSKKIETYPLCYENDIYTSYLIIQNDVLNNYKNDYNVENPENNFKFYNNLDENEYVALWKYNGFYIMNKDNIKTINIFEKDRYNNDLSIIVNNKILMANYDESQYFKNIVILDITTGEYEVIESKHEIYYDSYFTGNNKDNVYLYDKKTYSLYEINIKNKQIKLISNTEKGFIKYVNGKKVEATLNEYNKEKITYFSDDFTYTYKIDKNNTFISMNNDLWMKLSNNTLNIIKDNINNIYYSEGNYFYRFNNYSGIKTIFYDFELNFNSNNRIFVYIK